MNFVFKQRTIVVWAISLGLLIMPRFLIFYGFTNQFLLDLTSGWATFCLVFIAMVVLFWKRIFDFRFAIPATILAVVIAFFLTNYLTGITAAV